MTRWELLAARLLARWKGDGAIALSPRTKRLAKDFADWLAEFASEHDANIGDWLIGQPGIDDVFVDDEVLLVAIRDELDRLGPASPEEPEEPEQLLVAKLGRTFYRAEVAPDGEVADASRYSRFGGHPHLGPDEPWPRCESCDRELPLFAQIDLAELPAEFEGPHRQGLVQLFYCTTTEPLCEVVCEAWGPYARSVVARCIDPVESPRAVRSDEARTRATRLIRWYAAGSELPAYGEPLELDDDMRELLDTYRNEEDSTYRAHVGDKLGGWPAWVQDPMYPSCRTCKRAMRYLVQLESNGVCGHQFGDLGAGHIFQCDAHRDQVAFAWACH